MKFKDLEEGKSCWVYLEDIRQEELGETTSAEIGGVRCTFYNGISVESVEVIPEREKVTIPKVVAEWIEEHKGQFSTVYTAFSILTKREYGIKKWVNDNQDTFARAWLDGYTVEEPLGVLLVDLPVDASYSYLRYGNRYLIEYTDTIKTINLRAIKVTEAEAKEKYPNFRWVSLEELENED